MNTEYLRARNEIATISRSFSKCLSSWEWLGSPNFLALSFLGSMEETECGNILSSMTLSICHRACSYLSSWFASLPYWIGYFLSFYPRKRRSQLSPMNPSFIPSPIQNKCDFNKREYFNIYCKNVTYVTSNSMSSRDSFLFAVYTSCLTPPYVLQFMTLLRHHVVLYAFGKYMCTFFSFEVMIISLWRGAWALEKTFLITAFGSFQIQTHHE